MKDEIAAVHQVLEDAYKGIDHHQYPVATALIEHLTNLVEHFVTESGQIEANRLALSMITIVSLLEQRVNKLEDTISKKIK